MPRFLDGLKLSLSILMAGALLSAPTTVQQLQSADLPQLASLVQVDDTVTCTLRDGSTATIKVTSVEHDALVGANQRVPIADVTRAEIKRLDTTKSVCSVWPSPPRWRRYGWRPLLLRLA